jgi:hypothetical protein
MKLVIDDGGRAAYGYKGKAPGDCVCRAIAIVTGRPYPEIYARLNRGSVEERCSRGPTAAKGIRTRRKWFKDLMSDLGFEWVSCMGIGTGAKVHLHDGELPMGRLVVKVSRHLTAVIDGVIHDTFNPQREAHIMEFNGASSSNDPRVTHRIARRCVYGYWKLTT